MARPQHIFVFAYDIVRDRLRTKVADLLEQRLVRVQDSVFEGRMTAQEAKRLGETLAGMIEPDDSLRIYCITEAGRDASLAFGPTPLPEAAPYYLV